MRGALAALGSAFAALLMAVAGSPAARAQETSSAAERPKSDLRVKGRVFAREETTTLRAAGERQWRHEQKLDSARLGAIYRRSDYLRVEVDAEMSGGDLDLKDGFLRFEPAGELVRIEAGRFKRPMSVIGLASKWDLPSTERGLLASLEVEGQDLPFSGGRGNGASVRLAPSLALEPRFTAAVFQNPLGAGAAGLDASESFAQDVYARADIEPVEDLRVASSYAVLAYLREVGNPDSFRHASVVSLELEWGSDYHTAWIEGYLGKSVFASVGQPARGRFWATRAIVAPRFERESWPKRIEPFVLASFFDPSSSRGEDANSDLGLGVNVGFTRFLRLQTDVTHRFAHGDSAAAIEATVIRVQLATRFEG